MKFLAKRMHWVAVLGCIALLGASTTAGAREFCVHTVDELSAALSDAADRPDIPSVIKVVKGTYNVYGSTLQTGFYNGLRVDSFGPMQLLGGYDAVCEARELNPANTVFDSMGHEVADFSEFYGDVRIEGITFQNFGGDALRFFATEDGSWVKIDNNVFRHTSVYVVEGFYNDAFSFSFNNNLVAGATSAGDGVYVFDDGPMHFDGNTIVDNSGYGLWICGDGDVELGNNIVWNNSSEDIHIACPNDTDPGTGLFYENIYGTKFAYEATGSYGTSHSDPQFVGAAGGNYRLQGGSPAINSGDSSLSHPGVDLDGNPRVVGSTIDRGAYESSVDDTIPTTLTVTNANDQGPGSLRQAILDANASPDFSYINFNIPGTCPIVIAPDSADLPKITHGVRIDGYTQPGSKANSATQGDNATRCIVLSGQYGLQTGLWFAGASGEQFWLQGLVIKGFSANGLLISGGTGSLVWGNQFGGRFNGATLTPNGKNIAVSGDTYSNQIGGDAPAQLNVIDGATGAGVSITGLPPLFMSTGNSVIGNLIGTWGGETGTLVGNAVGVDVSTSGNSVRDNVIVGSGSDGVLLHGTFAHDNTIENNRIGRIDSFCFSFPTHFCYNDDAPNGRHGVRIEAGAHDNLVQGNTVWYNTQMGISVADSGKNNELSANSIYQNGSYGIDLDGVGRNDNDSDHGATNLPNRGLNYPEQIQAWGGTRHGTVSGMLFSTNGNYQIQVFSSAAADNMSNGEGEVFHRSGLSLISNASPGIDGSDAFSISFSSPTVSLAGRQITLTAIDSNGNTSEFSESVTYLCDVIFRNGYDDSEGEKCPAP